MRLTFLPGLTVVFLFSEIVLPTVCDQPEVTANETVWTIPTEPPSVALTLHVSVMVSDTSSSTSTFSVDPSQLV